MAHVAPSVTLLRFCSRPETIYFVLVLVPSILNGNYLNILRFSKNLAFRVHSTLVASKFVKIRLSRNSTKFVWVTRFLEMIPMVNSVSSSEIYK